MPHENIEVESLKSKISKLEEAMKEREREIAALLKGMQDAEKEIGEPLMPTGTYMGIDFQ